MPPCSGEESPCRSATIREFKPCKPRVRKIAPVWPGALARQGALPSQRPVPVSGLDGELSTWGKLYDCTPPAGAECLRFWWAIESAPWKRISAEAAAQERREEARRRTDEAMLSVVSFATEMAVCAAADWE
jgi:hypothetical protein